MVEIILILVAIILGIILIAVLYTAYKIYIVKRKIERKGLEMAKDLGKDIGIKSLKAFGDELKKMKNIKN